MTVTEDAPAAVTASSEPTAPAPAAPGLAAILGSGDHKVVGRLWIIAALAHILVAGAGAGCSDVAAAAAGAFAAADASSVTVIDGPVGADGFGSGI